MSKKIGTLLECVLYGCEGPSLVCQGLEQHMAYECKVLMQLLLVIIANIECNTFKGPLQRGG